MKRLEEILSEKYKYKKLPQNLSTCAQEIYTQMIPIQDSPQALYTSAGTIICSSYERIVIGDYGAYVEFSSEQANKAVFTIAPGQEYRLEERYKNCKYIWLTIADGSEVKIYYQKHTVDYADYKPKYYYVSVHEVYPQQIIQLFGGNEND
jgi:hypothetical protein